MNDIESIAAVGVAGFVLGAVAMWVFVRLRHAAARATLTARKWEVERLSDEMEDVRHTNQQQATEIARLTALAEQERKVAEEKLALLDQAQSKLQDAFQAVTAEALRANNEAFLEIARASMGELHRGATDDLEERQKALGSLIDPIGHTLRQLFEKVEELEADRLITFAALDERLQDLSTGQKRVAAETANLAKALRAPQVRGRWGELQLRRVVELAGMAEHCDFEEPRAGEDDGLRPDLIVRLPGQKMIAVDAKVPIAAFLDAMEAEDEAVREKHLEQYALQVRAHLEQLANEAYWSQFPVAPDFVVLFLPGETFFNAACQKDPGLIEDGLQRRVVLASPTTLISLLKTAAYGWQHERVAEKATQIRELGQTLYDRLRAMSEQFNDIRKGLERTVEAYNRAAGSLEGRVLPAARRFKDLEAGSAEDLPVAEVVEVMPRALLGVEKPTEAQRATLEPALPPAPSGKRKAPPHERSTA